VRRSLPAAGMAQLTVNRCISARPPCSAGRRARTIRWSEHCADSPRQPTLRRLGRCPRCSPPRAGSALSARPAPKAHRHVASPAPQYQPPHCHNRSYRPDHDTQSPFPMHAPCAEVPARIGPRTRVVASQATFRPICRSHPGGGCRPDTAQPLLPAGPSGARRAPTTPACCGRTQEVPDVIGAEGASPGRLLPRGTVLGAKGRPTGGRTWPAEGRLTTKTRRHEEARVNGALCTANRRVLPGPRFRGTGVPPVVSRARRRCRALGCGQCQR